MAAHEFETIVIGAGSAGLSFATTAAGLGARILLVERAELGGTCVNRGCVPKKILWAAGKVAKAVSDAASQGIMAPGRVDFQTLVQKRDAHIDGIRTSYAEELETAGVTLERGDAVVVDAQTVRVGDTTFTADQIVLATGGHPVMLDIEGSEALQTSDDVLSWDRRPGSIAIIGGGYIGCEFAAIFAALGSSVTLIHEGAHVLDTYPKPLALHVQDSLKTAGIALHLNDSVEALHKDGDALTYALQSGAVETADVVVAATGRKPNVDGLGEIVALLERGKNGALAVSERFETGCPGLYAIGDVADRVPLTPVASSDGAALAHILHGRGAAPIDLDLVATTTFIYPPAAHIGTITDDPILDETVTPLEQSVIAPDGSTPDFYRICADTKSGALTGVALAADGAEDLIALAAALIAAKAPSDVMTMATPVHPSFAEEFFPDIRKDA